MAASNINRVIITGNLTSDPELRSLEHTLRITDGVQRFRIIKLAPGVGSPPDLASAPATAPSSDETPPPA